MSSRSRPATASAAPPKGGAAPSLGLKARANALVDGGMPRAHAHSDVELNLVLAGRFTYFVSGRLLDVTAGNLYVFWAGTPHRVVESEPGTRQIWMTVPLDRVLPWRLPEAFMGRLLRGDLMVDPGPGDVADEPLFARWVRDLETGDPALAQIVGLEVEARLRRFANAQAAGVAERRDPAAAAPRGADAEHKAIFAEVAARIEAACLEDLPIAALLEGAGVSADYAGRIFKACCGMSPLEYRTQLRIAHAQRLLIEGKASITDVALASGFGSLGRFYAAFRRICGETPRAYRKGLG